MVETIDELEPDAFTRYHFPARRMMIRTDGMTILLVDDDGDRLESLRDVLRGMKHEVVVASSAEQAQSALWNGPFDAVVTDHDLGTTHGDTLLRQVATWFPAIRRMIFSAGDLPSTVDAHVAIERMNGIGMFLRAVNRLLSP